MKMNVLKRDLEQAVELYVSGEEITWLERRKGVNPKKMFSKFTLLLKVLFKSRCRCSRATPGDYIAVRVKNFDRFGRGISIAASSETDS